MAYTPDEFAAVLLGAGGRAAKATEKVVKRGAQNVKMGAQANVRRTAPVHNAGAAGAITYDDPSVGVVIASEIGYDKGRRGGPLGNLLEYGGGGDHSPPHHDLRLAAEAEEPKFLSALGDVVEQAIE